MKCPKCRYTSFDFYDACPKCGRDMTAERRKLNLPSLRPDPPLLIGALIGQSNASGAGWRLEAPGKRMGIEGPREEAPSYGAEDSQAIEDLEIGFEDSQALGLEPEAVPDGPTREPTEMHGDSLKLDLDDLQLEDEREVPPGPSAPQGAGEGAPFSAKDLPEAGPPDAPSAEAEDLDIEIGDLVIEDLPLEEPIIPEVESDLEQFVATTVMEPRVRFDPPASAGPGGEKPALPPPAPETKTPQPPLVEVFFDLEDIKEDEIASIKFPEPRGLERIDSRLGEEETVTPGASPSPPPVKPAVSEELKLDWKEFQQDFDAGGEGGAKK
jgi:hypothetical protein